VFRVTRLLTTDDVLTVPREWVHVRGGWWSRVLDCDWCTSMYVGTAAALVFWLWPEVTYWLSLPFAFSAVAGLLSRD